MAKRDDNVTIVDQLVDCRNDAKNLRYELSELERFAFDAKDPETFRRVVADFRRYVAEIIDWLEVRQAEELVRERRRTENPASRREHR